MNPSENKRIAMRISIISIAVNLVLSAFKFIAGIVAKSGAMISDAVHSASDVLSTIVVMVGVSISSKASDDEHPYGHERIECIAAILLAFVLLLTGLGIGIDGMKKITSGAYAELQIPGRLALIAAVISIVVKEWMYWFTRHAAKKINSGALMADAWHHRSDALSSVGSFVGILGARMGFPVLDSVACVIICVFIVKAAYDIGKDAFSRMVDKSCDRGVSKRMGEVVLAQQGVLALDDIRTRVFGSRVYVDIEISADAALPLAQAHAIAEQVHDVIEAQFPEVKHCMVHVNPMIN